MHLTDIVLKESTSQRRAGREYQHLEDLVYTEGGSPGAYKAVEILKRLSASSDGLTVKFDGMPTFYAGRHPTGEFVLVGKNGWGREFIRTPEELEEWIISRGNNEPWRARFARTMSNCWRAIEPIFPKDFRGFIYGDLLWYPEKPYVIRSNRIEFTPNLVTYTVPGNSPLGRMITSSSWGAVCHTVFKNFGDNTGVPVTGTKEFNTSPNFVFLGQVEISGKITGIQSKQITQIENLIKQHTVDMNGFLVQRTGLSDIAGILYRYVNYMSKEQKLNQLVTGFWDWLSQSNISENKKNRIKDLNKTYPTAIKGIFTIVSAVMEVKNQLIQELDTEHKQSIYSRTGNVPGGEGYVDSVSKTKLVPRHRWRPQW